jgi:hypothetical protein
MAFMRCIHTARGRPAALGPLKPSAASSAAFGQARFLVAARGSGKREIRTQGFWKIILFFAIMQICFGTKAGLKAITGE